MQNPQHRLDDCTHPILFDLEDLTKSDGSPITHHLATCDARTAFDSEDQFEFELMRDHAALAVISRTLGAPITTVRNQLYMYRGLLQRSDITATSGNRKRPLAILELMLTPLDSDHIARGILYVTGSNAPNLIFIAPSFPPRAQALINEVRKTFATFGRTITVHLIRLATLRSPHTNETFYELETITLPNTKPLRNRAFLEALTDAVSELGDTSLEGLSAYDNRRMDSYQGLGESNRIRIYAGESSTQISIMVPSKRLRSHLKQVNLPERIADRIQDFGLEHWHHSHTTNNVLATYRFATPSVTPTGADEAQITNIAMAYTGIREDLLTAIAEMRPNHGLRRSNTRYVPKPNGITDNRNAHSAAAD